MKNAVALHSLLLALLVSNVTAATRTWDGSANGLLSNAANWVEGVAPVNGDDLVFPASGVSRFNVTNNILGGPRFPTITFNGSGFTLSGAFIVTSRVGGENPAGVNRVNCALQLSTNGTLYMNGAAGSSLGINGNVTIGPYSLSVSGGGGTLVISGAIIGTGGISKISGGTVRFDGAAANTYTGTTTVFGGTLELSKSGTLAVPGNLIIDGGGDIVRLLQNNQIASTAAVTIGGSLDLNGWGNTIGALTLGGGSVTGGTLTLNGNVTATAAGAASISGNLVLGSAIRTFTVNDGPAVPVELSIDALISGTGGITKAGAGTLAFTGSASNTYAGETRVNDGTLLLQRTSFDRSIAGNLFIGDGLGGVSNDVVRIENFAQINNFSAVVIGSSGLLDQNGISEVIGSLDGAGRVEVGPNNLGVGVDGSSTTYSGEIIGSGALTKMGLGTLTLNGTNSNTGTTLVADGTLLVDGVQPQSPIDVINGTLGGDGTVGHLTAGGNVAPGASPGSLACSNLNFSSTGDLFVELNGPLSGSGYDQIAVRGGVTLNSPTLHVSIGSPPSPNQRFTIILNDGSDPVTGTFAGLPNGALLTVEGIQFHVAYDSLGNDVALVVTNTPLSLTGSTMVSGVNVTIDPNECNLLTVVLTNVGAAPVTGIRATLIPISDGWSVTQPFSTYADLAPGARGSNQAPFQASLLPGWVCGTPFIFELIMETDGYGPFRLSRGSSTGLLGTPARFDNNTPLAIPDLSSANSTINVSGIATAMQRITVSLHITHPSVEDLDISLINPAGLLINLSSDNGGATTNYGTGCADNQRTTFSDFPTANPSITTASPPFVGTFRPEVALGNFTSDYGPAVNGLWTLRVTDDAGGDVGTLQCWSLIITPSFCFDSGGPCESCPERTIFGSIGDQSQLQLGRLNRNGITSACGAAKSCPGRENFTQYRFDAYTFENGESNACITVTLGVNPLDGGDLFSAAYTNIFDPMSSCQNYLADLGSSLASGETNSYSFNVAAHARFVVVVSQSEPSSDQCRYRLDVTGGSCRPTLRIRHTTPSQSLLSWTTAALGYQLEYIDALPNPPLPQWVPMGVAPSMSNSHFRLTFSTPPGNSRFFFRLRKP